MKESNEKVTHIISLQIYNILENGKTKSDKKRHYYITLGKRRHQGTGGAQRTFEAVDVTKVVACLMYSLLWEFECNCPL